MYDFSFLQKKKTTSIAVEVRKSQHKYVIGPKGNSLQEILERTGVSVEIPPSDSSSETVILRGEPEKLGQALTEVYAKVKTSLCIVSFIYRRDDRIPQTCLWSLSRLTALQWPLSLLHPGCIGSLLAKKDRTWQRSHSRYQRWGFLYVRFSGMPECLNTFSSAVYWLYCTSKVLQ